MCTECSFQVHYLFWINQQETGVGVGGNETTEEPILAYPFLTMLYSATSHTGNLWGIHQSTAKTRIPKYCYVDKSNQGICLTHPATNQLPDQNLSEPVSYTPAKIRINTIQLTLS